MPNLCVNIRAKNYMDIWIDGQVKDRYHIIYIVITATREELQKEDEGNRYRPHGKFHM
jgi:hypothetical protein